LPARGRVCEPQGIRGLVGLRLRWSDPTVPQRHDFLLLLDEIQSLLQLAFDAAARLLFLPVPARELCNALLRGPGLPANRG
jgi:hypothetical protein